MRLGRRGRLTQVLGENIDNNNGLPNHVAGHAADIPARLAAAKATWRSLIQQPQLESLASFQRGIRQLTTAAEAAGFLQLAELLSMVDLMLAPVLAAEDRFTAELGDIVRDYLAAASRLGQEKPTVATSADSQPLDQRTAPAVLLLETDRRLAQNLQHQISHFDYDVRTAADFPGLFDGLEQTQSRLLAIILDGATATLAPEQVAEVRQRTSKHIPLIYLSGSEDVESRLAAARAGADVYLVKPFDLHELIDQLDRIGIDNKQEPFHIVVVEDSPTQAAYYSAILQKAGMLATVVSDPYSVLQALDENAADLILMDMYMPGCNGMELARVIRQVPRHASIPIVYLSAEMELSRQLDALSLGADDFLTKPINPMHLIRSVTIRAERARSLRTLMLTDNLTGLLNHSRIKELLQTEVARAMRSGMPLAFAMLDIDHFKSVNDTHGHHVGDRVIKTMARVLQQRLRQTDYIGRYGGEEFAVILPDANLESAVRIVDEVRQSFNKVHQLAASGAFNVSFSGGVAAFPASRDATKLALDADKALYAAKRQGRNRIIAYSASLG